MQLTTISLLISLQALSPCGWFASICSTVESSQETTRSADSQAPTYGTQGTSESSESEPRYVGTSGGLQPNSPGGALGADFGSGKPTRRGTR